MKDLRLKIYVRNNLVLKRLEEVHGSITLRETAQRSKVCLPSLYELLSFKRSPVTSRCLDDQQPIFEGLYWTRTALKLANFLKCSPWDIFPEHFWTPKQKSKYEAEIDSLQILSLSENDIRLLPDGSPDPLKELITKEELGAAISTLGSRYTEVLKLRFFQQQTLREAAEIVGVAPERIRQLEAKALQKLKLKLEASRKSQ